MSGIGGGVGVGVGAGVGDGVGLNSPDSTARTASIAATVGLLPIIDRICSMIGTPKLNMICTIWLMLNPAS